jgi:hypothetical protein
MNIRSAIIICVAGLITASCSKKLASTPKGNSNETERSPAESAAAEAEQPPQGDEIAEDCAALVRSTKVVPSQGPKGNCPTCPAAGSEALSFREAKTECVSCAGETCTAVVTIHAVFNPAAGEAMAGGLTAWIPPEDRIAYLNGEVPAGEQQYHVQITYRRRGGGWRVVDFDRPAG